jgi:Phosphotransferase enzyme family
MEGDDTPAWQSTLHAAVLVPDPGGEPRLLLFPEGDGWSLPRAILPEQVWWPVCRWIIAAVQQQLGVDAVVLSCAAEHSDEDRREVEVTYLLEPRQADWAPPPAARAVDRATLASLPFALPAQRPILDRCLIELAAVALPGRMPWMRPGWFATASTWIGERLHDAGLSATGPVEQLSNWGISCVLRIPTAAGDHFFKAIPPGSGSAPVAGAGLLFANEPALLAALAEHFPSHVPAPLAVDRERRWQLLADVGSPLAEHPDYALWEEAMRTFSRLQVASVEQVDDLLQVGCVDRRPQSLLAEIDPLLADPNTRDTLGAEELARLRALASRLRSACAELAGFGVPPALVHGDLHAANIAVRNGDITFFDWTDACVAHPFVDVPLLLQDAGRVLAEPDAGGKLREAYLSEWTAVAPIDRLREAYAVAEPVVALHHAVSYRHIVANVDPVSALAFRYGLDLWLRALLASLTVEAGH